MPPLVLAGSCVMVAGSLRASSLALRFFDMFTKCEAFNLQSRHAKCPGLMRWASLLCTAGRGGAGRGPLAGNSELGYKRGTVMSNKKQAYMMKIR